MGIRETFATVKRGPVLIFIATALALSFGAFVSGVDASDKRLVSIYADGQKQTIASEATTVEQVLENADVELHEKDLVEPSRDTAISQDVFKINVYRARPYTIIDQGKETDVLSAYQSPRLIAENSGIKVHPEDRFEVKRINNIVGETMIGQEIKIVRATAVNLNVYGEKAKYRTHAKTVADVIEEKELKLAENDVVAPTGETKLEHGMEILVISVGNSANAVEEPIPFPTENIYDSNIDAGQTQVKQEGQDGRRLVTYEVTLHNGVEAGRTEVQSVVLEEPVPQIQVVGTKSADPGSNISIGQSIAAGHGWTGAEWGCLYELWLHESGWNHLTSNYGGSGAYGIPQALPGNKMSSAGSDWATNPRTQINWGIGYINGRYGTPCGAKAHSDSVGWY